MVRLLYKLIFIFTDLHTCKTSPKQLWQLQNTWRAVKYTNYQQFQASVSVWFVQSHAVKEKITRP